MERVLPQEVISEVIAEQQRIGFDKVPKYVEFKNASGVELFLHWKNLTVALCEQSVDFYTRRAIKYVNKWLKKPSPKLVEFAARDIVFARMVRCKYFELTKAVNTSENDMPFPHCRYTENQDES